jgi:GNAT superfamily N-acetyltransferase
MVQNKREQRLFLEFPWQVYRDDPLWVPPLLPERVKALDPRRGVFFTRGIAESFIAWRDGKPVGTICAAEDRRINEQCGLSDCMFGFFDCIDDYSVAEALLDRARQWGRERGLKHLYGPYNLDYEDSYGILIEGRDRPPAILCGHTPVYYQGFIERYGFHPARGDNLAFCFDLDASHPSIARLRRLAERIRHKGKFTLREADMAHWEDEADRILALINLALAHLPGFTPWQPEAMRAMLKSFLPIADPELVLFAERDGELVGWFPGLPNLNEAFIHVDGLRRPWDYLRLWWWMRRQPECLAIKSVLVRPDHWDTGVSILLFDEMAQRAIAKGYKWVDLSITSDDNPDTPVLAKHVGARIYKRWRVYRKPI